MKPAPTPYGKPVVMVDGVPIEDVDGVEMIEAGHNWPPSWRVGEGMAVDFGDGFKIAWPEGNRHERRKRAAQERRR